MSPAAVVLLVAQGLLALWSVSLAGAIARTPARERAFRTVSALAGLFLLPGALVQAATGSELTARVADGIWWFWPLTVTLFAVQSAWAVGARLATRLTGLPIALWNVALAGLAWTDALLAHDLVPTAAPWAGGALRLAQAALTGPGALVAPVALWVPLIGPAYPPRWRASAAVRGAAALAAGFALLLVGASVPRAQAIERSFDRLRDERLTERPLGDFALGLVALPVLDHPAPPVALARDLALADTMGADALLVTVAPTVRAGALDSIAHVLEALRRDSLVVLVAPALDAAAPAGPERDRMLVAMERTVRRLQPDYVVTEPLASAGEAPVAQRRRWFELVRTATRRGGSGARVLPAVRPREAERGWFAWADSAAGGVALVPDATAGGDALVAELQVATRMLADAPRAADGVRATWVLGPRTAPAAAGEGAQARALYGVIAWATRTPGVAGVLAGPTADYATVAGLRDAGGRSRAAQGTLIRAARAIQQSAR